MLIYCKKMLLPVCLAFCMFAPQLTVDARRTANEPRRAAAKTAAKPAAKPAVKKQTIRYIIQNKRRYFSLRDVAACFDMLPGRTQTGPILFSRTGRVDFTDGKRTGKINKTTVTFFYPPVKKNGLDYISEHDYRKILEPALRKKLKRHTLKRIMIDPGHGGTDQGAPGPVAHEKVINLKIAQLLRKELLSYGFEVVMTRSGDQTVSLADRSALCKKHKADLYLSIHCKATTNKSVTGIETWLLAAQGGQSAKESTPKTKFDTGNKFDLHNFRLAYELQKGLKKTFPKSKDRGVKPSRFAVLRNATAPAVLLEVGFLSNNREGRSLATAKTQKLIVDGIIEGLTGYVEAIR